MENSHQTFTNHLGNNIRRYRLELKMTVEELAMNSGLAYSQVSRIELGKIKTSAYTVYLLANALKVSPAVLFDCSLMKEEKL